MNNSYKIKAAADTVVTFAPTVMPGIFVVTCPWVSGAIVTGAETLAIQAGRNQLVLICGEPIHFAGTSGIKFSK